MKISSSDYLKAKYPDEFPNQCPYLKNVCPSCGSRFGEGMVLECPQCKAPRPRCQNKKMTNEDSCRAHARGRAYSMYNRLAGHISDVTIEEFIEKDVRDLHQEFALAKIALSGALDKNTLSSPELMDLLRQFFDIAAKKKKIEEGDVLKVTWNDDLVDALRKRWREVVTTLGSILEEELREVFPDPSEREVKVKLLMTKIRERTKMLGNKITMPKDDIKAP